MRFAKIIFYLFVLFFSASVLMPVFGLEYRSNFELVELAMIPITGTLYMSSDIGLGRVFSHHPNTYIETKGAEVDIPFGIALHYNSANRDLVRPVASATGEFAGVSMYSTSASKLSEDLYKSGDVTGVGQSGILTVRVEEAVNPGDQVRIRHTNGVGPNAGKLAGSFCKTADAGRTMVLNGARFEKRITAAGEGVVFIPGNRSVTAD